MLRAKASLLAYLGPALPVIAGFGFVAAYGVNVPVQDQWDGTVSLLLKNASGDLGLQDLFAQHNEHRIFFPRLVMLALGRATHYDTVAEMYVTQVALLGVLVLLLLAIRSAGVRLPVLALTLTAFLVFSLRQYETMLLGFNIGFAFVEAFGVLGLYLLFRSQSGRLALFAFVGALAAATIASYSGLQGLFVWPAGVLLVLLIEPRDQPPKLLFGWTVVGICEWALYFVGYVRPPNHPSPYYSLGHPLESLRYFVTLLGGALFDGEAAALGVGALLLVGAATSIVLIVRRRRQYDAALWLALLAFSFAMLASIAVGRAGFGTGQALSSRYTSYSLLAVVAIGLLWATLTTLNTRTVRVGALIAFVALIGASAVSSYPKGRDVGHGIARDRKQLAFWLATYRTEPDDKLAALFPSPEYVRHLAPGLERLRYSVFADPKLPPPLTHLAARSEPSSCTVDNVNGIDVASRREVTAPLHAHELDIGGWCVDPTVKRPAGGVYVVVDGRRFAASYGVSRSDVADYLKTPAYGRAGFERALWLPGLSPGRHTLSAIALSADGTSYYQPNPSIALTLR
jgi:hypothetical protein